MWLPPATGTPLLASQLEEQAAIAFLHVNKAGGQTVKHVLFEAVRTARWDGAGLGTIKGWAKIDSVFRRPPRSRASGDPRALHGVGSADAAGGEPALLLQGRARRLDRLGQGQAGDPLFFDCGVGAKLLRHTPNGTLPCALRAVWGSMSMGLCDLLAPRPCFYLLNIRDPVQRAISEYNYFCVQGAEGRRKWRPEWRATGRCPLNIVEYFEAGLAAPSILVERITRGCDSACGVAAAKSNLDHPCMRFLMLEHLADDAARLSKLLGKGALRKAFDNFVRDATSGTSQHRRNQTPWSRRVRLQVSNVTLMVKLKELMADDILVYEHALSRREAKWGQPLEACPAPRAASAVAP
eukprot:CAMPEP_0202083344 /NCGR_PEP_ID=MMETSP0964-20121228/23348_1 /ASSEMBLY_ACC=CAM_ASM_000500 /TAXON_ID=4773 /ORGANISM="Schizochytrium aggregatum, Strain ATCC28209" /LENGTH=351 /DNA_ID=CAMNT_0048651045 /DNA_START=24 /DNA_END=1079 /DNA_ORIENTATION=-